MKKAILFLMKYKHWLERGGIAFLCALFVLVSLYALGVFESPHKVVISFADDSMRYEGNWHSDDFSGEGTLRFADGDIYSGSFQSSRFDGFGTFKSTEQREISGIFSQGVLTEPDYIAIPGANIRLDFRSDGSVIIESRDYIYIGAMKDWLPAGKGEYFFADGSSYTGSLQNGLAQGYGVLKGANGIILYEGEWENGLPHGEGNYFDAEGNVLHTRFENGYPQDVIVIADAEEELPDA